MRILIGVGLSLLLATGAAAGSLNKNIQVTSASDPSDDYDTVNGSITVDDGVQLNASTELSTVNGAIRIGSSAIVGDVETVNGSVRLGDYSQAETVSTVNGSIKLGQNSGVAGNVESVNGALTLGQSGSVAGNMENVNGRITVQGARVEGDVTNYNGGMLITDGANVMGNLQVKKPNRSGWFDGRRKTPKIVIGPNSTVAGQLIFEQEVKLYVHESASVGNISGAEPIMFSGDRP